MKNNTKNNKSVSLYLEKDGMTNKEIFDQNPSFFMHKLVGGMVIDRLSNKEGDRLQRIFTRKFIVDILSKDVYTYEDYCNIHDWCC